MRISKIIAGIMAFCIMGMACPVVNGVSDKITAYASSETEYTEGTYEHLTYKNYGDYIEISGCDELATYVIIPSEIDGVPVTGIGNSAFYYCKGLISVTIPDSVTSIGDFAFGSCTSLVSVNIPDSVKSIGEYALYDTPWFKGKQQQNPLVIVNDILIDGSTCSGDIIIPDGITSISDFAFSGCTELTSIIIPDSIESIGIGVFSECTGLISVTIPDSVAIIDEMAFSECTSLISITIPDSVATIGITAFFECKNLESVTIPDNVMNIHCGAFCNCENLTSITILNPDCEIVYDKSTISNGWDININNINAYFNGTIYGYENSTAQVYAEKCGYKFESLGIYPENQTPTGDINGDGEFNVADAVMLNKYLLGGSCEELSEWQNADLCADGKLDSFDLCMMKKKLVEDLV